MAFVDGLSTYQLYSSIKTHFTSTTYDFFKYGLNSRIWNAEQFKARRDRNMYIKLGKNFKTKTELANFLAANFMYNVVWIGDLLENYDKAESVDRRHRGYMAAVSYHFKEDLGILFSQAKSENVKKFRDIFLPAKKYDIPLAYRLLLNGTISPNTLILLSRVTDLDFIGLMAENATPSSVNMVERVSFSLSKFKQFVSVRDRQELDTLVGIVTDSIKTA